MSKTETNLQGKVCLITGANSGIGFEAAKAIAATGARTVIVCRNRERGEPARAAISAAAGGAQVDLLTADLSSQKQIRELAAAFKSQYDRLDILVNNAGLICRPRRVTEDGLEMTFAVNHLAYFLLTNLLLDVLKASAPSRIVNVASDAHTSGTINFDDLQGERRFTTWSAYAQSKLANILFTYELARRLEGTGVTANCLHPGVVATGIFRVLPKLIAKPMSLFFASPAQGARTTIYLATSPEVEGVTGQYFVDMRPRRSSRESYDESVARRLWEESERLAPLQAADAGC